VVQAAGLSWERVAGGTGEQKFFCFFFFKKRRMWFLPGNEKPPMFKAMRKRWILRGYATRLPRALRRDYGKANFYTPGQIRSSIERHRFSPDYFCYALALYTDPVSFTAYHDARAETCDYFGMRGEVSGFGEMTAASFIHACHDFLHRPDATHHHAADAQGHHDGGAHHASGGGDFGGGHGHH
jgi:hypothetical protein